MEEVNPCKLMHVHNAIHSNKWAVFPSWTLGQKQWNHLHCLIACHSQRQKWKEAGNQHRTKQSLDVFLVFLNKMCALHYIIEFYPRCAISWLGNLLWVARKIHLLIQDWAKENVIWSGFLNIDLKQYVSSIGNTNLMIFAISNRQHKL